MKILNETPLNQAAKVYFTLKILALTAIVFYPGLFKAQEIGYLSGVTKQGIEPGSFQPLYGFTIGAKINKVLAIETALFYSQRTIGNTVQADYFSFVAFPKIGYFGEKAGIYYSPGLALNPTLHHSNIKNHTYLSTIQSVGGQINIKPKIIVDLKIGYDFGLTGAYFENNGYQKYSGAIILAGLKFLIAEK